MTIELNKEQKDVIDHKDGPVLVLAGPGTGKTMTIIVRVEKLVDGGVDPKKILCITFTEKATGEMKLRLEKKGNTTTVVSTFHAFCREICSDNFIKSGLSDSSKLMKETSLQVWCLKNFDAFGINPDVIDTGKNLARVTKGMVQALSNFKESLISSKKFQEWLDAQEEKISKYTPQETKDYKELISYVELHQEFNKVYSAYEKFQQEKEIFDFDDMILKAINLLKKDAGVLENYQKKYDYILVDEFQDNNYSQFEVVRLLGGHGNVMGVGDDDQLIMRFQGARQENFDEFLSKFNGAKVKQLGQNYRCTEKIVEMSKLILPHIADRKDKVLSALRTGGEKVKVIRADTDKGEVEYVVEKIRELIGTEYVNKDGETKEYRYSDFAILSRQRKFGDKFVNGLNVHGIPSTHIGDFNIFETAIISELMLYLRIIESPTKAGMYLDKLMSVCGIADVNISTINHTARDAKRQSVVGFASKSTIVGLVYHLIYSDATGLYKRCLLLDNTDNRLNILLLNTFYELTEEYQNLNPDETYKEFLEYLELLREVQVDIEEKFDVTDTVHVMTMHKSKGKQYPVVFVADVAGDKFPGTRITRNFYVHDDLLQGSTSLSFSKKVQLADERRLFYVAVTRAENLLFIMAPKKYEGNVNEKDISIFLTEIDFENQNELIEVEEYEDKDTLKFSPKELHERIKYGTQVQAIDSINRMQLGIAINRIIELARISYLEEHRKDDPECTGFDPKSVLAVDLKDVDLNQELIGKPTPLFDPKDFTVSKSSLETYDDCPYKFLLSKILRTPSPGSIYTDLGTSIHEMIQETADTSGKIPTKAEVMQKLKEKWHWTTFQNATSEGQFYERAKNMTENYLEWRKNNKNKFIASEFPTKFEYKGLTLNGKIDWIEENPNGELEVVDFKTGKSVTSQNKANVDWQLHIYAWLIEHDPKFGKLPVKASLYFLEKNKMVSVDIDKKKVEELLEYEVQPLIERILKNDFKADPESYKCSQCEYRNICDYSLG